jgi:hypothetical protein
LRQLFLRRGGIDIREHGDNALLRLALFGGAIGPNAGWLTTAAIPYSTSRREAATRKVFDGPYPE